MRKTLHNFFICNLLISDEFWWVLSMDKLFPQVVCDLDQQGEETREQFLVDSHFSEGLLGEDRFAEVDQIIFGPRWHL